MQTEYIIIEVLDEQCLNDFCVYRLWFGHHFYIGSTKNIINRVTHHQKAINLAIECGYRYGKNAITNIANLLLSNPSIKTGYFEVLEVCATEIDLVEVEFKRLKDVYSNPLCLNEGKSTARRISGELYRPSQYSQHILERDVPLKSIDQDLVLMKKVRKSLRNLGIIQ